MATYAALVSLINTIHNIQNHSRLSTSLDKSQIESLGENLDFLLDFVENHHSHGGNKEAEDLERQIASAAHAAEDVIESHIVARIEPLMARSSTFDDEEASSRGFLDFLWNVMLLIENHPRFSTSINRKQIESLDLLLDFIESHNSDGGSKEAEVLGDQIAPEDQVIKDAIRSEMKDRLESIEENEEISYSSNLDCLVFYVEQILNHPLFWTSSLEDEDVEVFAQMIGLLRNFVETNYDSDGVISEEEVKDLESLIPGSTFDHGETSSSLGIDLQKEINVLKKKCIEVGRKILKKKVVFAGSENSFLPDLQKILEDMDSLSERAIKVKEGGGFKDVPPTYAVPAPSLKPLTTGKTSVIGLESYFVQLLDWLTAQQSDQQTIPITGMGGIGKTTLARKVYDNLLVVQHFDVRAWLTISQEYNVRELLLKILSSLGKSTEELGNKTEGELGVLLHKFLFGRRYLIILDDMWSIDTWNEISLYLPTEEKRSRIVVTTRLLDVASHFGTLRLALNFLDDNKSWDLFCEKAFEQGCFPSELENIGRKIVKKCNGLPLSIVVIGGLLGKSSRTQEHWENVERDLSSILNTTEDNQCFNILSLSYSHLPAHLKPCFLYLGIFPEDHEICISQLIQLWVAEGFLYPNIDPSLEEVAKSYVEDLVNRNLLFVHKLCKNGKFKTCSMHDLLRDLCIRVAEKEKFFCLLREVDRPRDIGRERRLITVEDNAKESHPLQSTSLIRSVISTKSSCQLSSKSKLLRVFSDAYGGSLDTVFQHVNLRFLKCCPVIDSRSSSYGLPSSISLLWNLQTLIIEGFGLQFSAPTEIWEMQQLRHLEFFHVSLPKPPPCDEHDRIVLRNLQTLQVAGLCKWPEEFSERMPNIKKLTIFFVNFFLRPDDTFVSRCFHSIGLLNKLESLHFNAANCPSGLLQNLKLPSSLKKLCLLFCTLKWDDLTRIGSLPHLEVLILDCDSATGPEWNPVEGEFQRLKYLRISSCNWRQWNAESCHFPVLEKLVILESCELGEIPSGIGDIPTLGDIYLVDCSISVVMSAVSILEEQESYGNEDLQVRVKLSDEMMREEVRKKVELEGFTSHNFQLF